MLQEEESRDCVWAVATIVILSLGEPSNILALRSQNKEIALHLSGALSGLGKD